MEDSLLVTILVQEMRNAGRATDADPGFRRGPWPAVPPDYRLKKQSPLPRRPLVRRTDKPHPDVIPEWPTVPGLRPQRFYGSRPPERSLLRTYKSVHAAKVGCRPGADGDHKRGGSQKCGPAAPPA